MQVTHEYMEMTWLDFQFSTDKQNGRQVNGRQVATNFFFST